MKLSLKLLTFSLVGFASAQQNTDDATEDVAPRPDWQPADAKYNSTSEWKSCASDSDCETDYYCLNHIWAYNGQIESGQGCWMSSVCSGQSSFDMFDGRKLQFFCTDEQVTAATNMTAPWGLTPGEKAFSEFKTVCATDADCPNPETQQCLEVLWDATEDGFNYANMMTCYNWDEKVCPGDAFAQENMNYENTLFSYYNHYSCVVGGDGDKTMTLMPEKTKDDVKAEDAASSAFTTITTGTFTLIIGSFVMMITV